MLGRRTFTMKRKRHTPEQIVRKLREGDRLLNEGTDLTRPPGGGELFRAERANHVWAIDFHFAETAD
jgi:hypothetical protein